MGWGNNSKSHASMWPFLTVWLCCVSLFWQQSGWSEQGSGSVLLMSSCKVSKCPLLTPIYTHTSPVTIGLLIWGTDKQNKHPAVRLCAVFAATSSSYLCFYLFFSSLTHFIVTIPFLSLTASLICPWVYNGNPLPGSTETESSDGSRRAKRLRAVRSHRFMEGHTGPAADQTDGDGALIVRLELLPHPVSSSEDLHLRKHHKESDPPPGPVQQLCLRSWPSCLTSVLWPGGTGMAVGIWAMPGRWLLVPVLDFKPDLQSERQRPCTTAVRQ